MSDAPYKDYPDLKPGDRVGWVDDWGTVHVETWTRTVGHSFEKLKAMHQAMIDRLGEVLDIEGGLREIIGDD